VHFGLAYEFRPYKGRYGGHWWCERERLPGYTERKKALETAMFTVGAYSIQSGELHAQWHSVIGNWEEVPSEDRTRAIVSRTDRTAVRSTVLLAPAPAIAVALDEPVTHAHEADGAAARLMDALDPAAEPSTTASGPHLSVPTRQMRAITTPGGSA
jgi:hypothetical protein